MPKPKKQPVIVEPETPVDLTCITNYCTNPMQWKGLCSHCYGQAKELINAGKTSWDELYQLNLALDDRPFMIAFELAKKP